MKHPDFVARGYENLDQYGIGLLNQTRGAVRSNFTSQSKNSRPSVLTGHDITPVDNDYCVTTTASIPSKARNSLSFTIATSIQYLLTCLCG